MSHDNHDKRSPWLTRSSTAATPARKAQASDDDADGEPLADPSVPSQHARTARKVFDITELLERILSFLKCRDLYVACRVNTTFKGCIDRSTLLRSKMRILWDWPDVDDPLRGFQNLVRRKGLVFEPYHFDGAWPLKNGWDMYLWDFGYEKDDLLHGDLAEGHGLGFRGRRKLHGPEQSWGSLAIANADDPICVRVRHFDYFDEQTVLSKGQNTLRHLFELLRGILERHTVIWQDLSARSDFEWQSSL